MPNGADNSSEQVSELRELKKRLQLKYLGKSGIHAFGSREAENAVCAYVHRGAEDLEAVLDELKSDVAPHKLVVIEESRIGRTIRSK